MGVALITVYIEIVPLCVRILYTHIPLSNETMTRFTVEDRLFYTGKKCSFNNERKKKIYIYIY